VLEVDDPADLPPWSVLVRRKGRAVAAYRSEAQARCHAAPLEDARVCTDRCAGLRRPARIWQVDQAQRAREDVVIEALMAEWLARNNVR
jgi:hypothetical protein